MKLSKDELEMLEGTHGSAKRRAMELLVQYGEALGAERLIQTNNVHMLIGFYPYPEILSSFDADQMVSKFFLDSDDKIIVDYIETFNTTHIWAIDLDQWRKMGASEELHRIMEIIRAYSIRKGISITATCAPYLVGNLPSRGEHCAWTESSAVPFCNAVLGARTNTETAHSAFAIALTGKVPLAGFHLDENRLATYLIEVKTKLDSIFDWNLLGYYAGEMVQLDVPAYDIGKNQLPNLNMLKALNAAGASSGGIQMYHIIGATPEAPNRKTAFGGKEPKVRILYGQKEKRRAFELLNSGKDEHIDVVTLGCPHYSLEQLKQAARILDGKKVNGNVLLWIWTAHALKDVADRNGYTEIIERAGGRLLTDSCPLVTKGSFPERAKTVATDSAKQAHYTPSIVGCETWIGTMEECIASAISGKWRGETVV